EMMLPNLNAPLYVDASGKLSADTVASFQSQAQLRVEQMAKEGELSAYSVNINPDQDVLSTSSLSIDVTLVPVGLAREIKVNIGFSVQL
ncbi:DUF2586 family protein, partial [Xanthovirga aplysinae]|uniref:DUF2586 family protein n=1 Tax=Xanthovirga aplysinae TaxID=2529853 RepID=UPI001CA3BCF1